MTVFEDLVISCNKCTYDETWNMSVLNSRSLESIIKNSGFTTKSHGFFTGKTHWCPDCNDREMDTFYVVDGYGEEYLGEVEAWGTFDARNKAWGKWNCEIMVSESREKLRERWDV